MPPQCFYICLTFWHTIAVGRVKIARVWVAVTVLWPLWWRLHDEHHDTQGEEWSSPPKQSTFSAWTAAQTAFLLVSRAIWRTAEQWVLLSYSWWTSSYFRETGTQWHRQDFEWPHKERKTINLWLAPVRPHLVFKSCGWGQSQSPERVLFLSNRPFWWCNPVEKKKELLHIVGLLFRNRRRSTQA